MDALLGIKGIGEAKAHKYGPTLLPLMAQLGGTEANHNEPLSLLTAGKQRIGTSQDAASQSHELTLQMFNNGEELSQIAAARGLSLATVENHLLRCSEEGSKLEWSRLLTVEQESLIMKTANELQSDKLKQLKENLPEEITYFHIKAALQKARNEQ